MPEKRYEAGAPTSSWLAQVTARTKRSSTQLKVRRATAAVGNLALENGGGHVPYYIP